MKLVFKRCAPKAGDRELARVINTPPIQAAFDGES